MCWLVFHDGFMGSFPEYIRRPYSGLFTRFISQEYGGKAVIKKLDHGSEPECGGKCTDSGHAAGQEADKSQPASEDSPTGRREYF